MRPWVWLYRPRHILEDPSFSWKWLILSLQWTYSRTTSAQFPVSWKLSVRGAPSPSAPCCSTLCLSDRTGRTVPPSIHPQRRRWRTPRRPQSRWCAGSGRSTSPRWPEETSTSPSFRERTACWLRWVIFLCSEQRRNQTHTSLTYP